MKHKKNRKPPITPRRFPFTPEESIRLNAHDWPNERAECIRWIREHSQCRYKSDDCEKMTDGERKTLRGYIHALAYFFRQMDAAITLNSAPAAAVAAMNFASSAYRITSWLDETLFTFPARANRSRRRTATAQANRLRAITPAMKEKILASYRREVAAGNGRGCCYGIAEEFRVSPGTVRNIAKK